MKEITTEKDVKAFVKLLERINQLFKGRVNDYEDNPERYSHYLINNGRIISMDETLISDAVTVILYEKNEVNIEDDFNTLSLDVNGVGLYSFLKDNKKYVNKIVIDDEGVQLVTSIPELEYRIKKPEKNNADLERYNQSRKEGLLKYIKPANLYETLTMDDDGVLEILNSNSAYIINVAEVNIRLTKKVIHGLKAKTKSKTTKGVKTTTTIVSKMIVNVYETDSDGVYVVNIIVDNSQLPEPLKINNFFAIANY